jgi:hypothetical protein
MQDKKTSIIPRYKALKCKHCNTDLLKEKNREKGIIVFETIPDLKIGQTHIFNIYWACKNKCDQKSRKEALKKNHEISGWENLTDLVMPSHYINWVINKLDRLHNRKDIYKPEAFNNLKKLIKILSQVTQYKESAREKELAEVLSILS